MPQSPKPKGKRNESCHHPTRHASGRRATWKHDRTKHVSQTTASSILLRPHALDCLLQLRPVRWRIRCRAVPALYRVQTLPRVRSLNEVRERLEGSGMNGNSDVINRAEVRRRLIRRAQDGPTAFHWRHFNPRVSEATL